MRELSFFVFVFVCFHQMGVRWGLCICVRVYLCMGWRGVGGVKVCVLNKLIVSEGMRVVIESLQCLSSTRHLGCMNVLV